MNINVNEIIGWLVGLICAYWAYKATIKNTDKEIKAKKDDDRREFIVSVILNDTGKFSREVRIEAAYEYIGKGYNGITKKYIVDNNLIDERIVKIFNNNEK
jgi:hypothetical protein